MRKVSSVNPTKWTPTLDQLLTDLLYGGKSYSEIAAVIGCTIAAVEARRQKIGLPSPTRIQQGIV